MIAFLSHYARSVRMFGPLMCYWTGRFESKHRVAKSTSESSKNVINVTKTIAERQQMRSASVFYHGMFNFSIFSLPKKVLNKSDITNNDPFHAKLKSFMSNDDLICNEIFVHNQSYRNGDIVVLEVTDCDDMNVGVIETILVKNEKVYFVTKQYRAVRHWLRYFECKNLNTMTTFTESNKLVDFKPLILRGTSERFVFLVHHHVSFMYK